MKKLTIVDIAKMAGVGTTTVSRYFNGGNLKNETRERLYSLISSMGIGCNLALNLYNNDVECRTDKETIVLHCREIVNEIENLLKYLRTEIQKI